MSHMAGDNVGPPDTSRGESERAEKTFENMFERGMEWGMVGNSHPFSIRALMVFISLSQAVHSAMHLSLHIR